MPIILVGIPEFLRKAVIVFRIPFILKAFIKLLFEGVTERRITLDFILDKRSSVKIRKMKPVIRNILRMGVYQMLYTDAPSYAVCKESVNLAGKRGFKGLGGQDGNLCKFL